MTVTWMTYNPSFLTSEGLVRQFVVRLDELETVVRVIRENAGPVNQHVLVIGARGFGKTMLVHRVAAAIERDPELASRWVPVLFGEESYQVSTVGELWLEALLHLADATGDPRVRAAVDELRAERDERRLASAGLARLLDFADREQRRLLLGVENLDALFEEQLDEHQAWALRKILLEEPRLMILGTTVRRFPGMEQPDRPMFDLFRRVEIEALEDVECLALWTAVTGTNPGIERAAAVRILAGGNPRLVVLLARFAHGSALRALLDDLAHLIDQYTGYFKHNIEALPAQQRRVFLALAELWSPSTARQVADVARVAVNKASAQLKRLEQDGRVHVIDTRSGAHVYQVSERLYNIYYLMRRRNGAEPRVRALMDFIRHFYEPSDAPALLNRIAVEACALEGERRAEHLRLVQGLLAWRHGDAYAVAEMARLLPPELYDGADFPDEVRQLVCRPEVLVELADGRDKRWKGPAKKLLLAAERALRDEPPRRPTAAEADLAAKLVHSKDLFITAGVVLYAAGRVKELLEAPTPEYRDVWSQFLAALAMPTDGFPVKAEHQLMLARHAASLTPDQPHPRIALGWLLVHHERDVERGRVLLEGAAEAPPEEEFWVSSLAMALCAAHMQDRAKAVVANAMEHHPDHTFTPDLFLIELTRGAFDAAESVALDWIEARPSDARAIAALLAVRYHKGDYSSTEASLLRLVELEPTRALYRVKLAQVLRHVGKGDEAIASARAAQRIDPDLGLAWAIELEEVLDRGVASEVESLLVRLVDTPEPPAVRRLRPVLQILLEDAPDTLLDRTCAWADGLLTRGVSPGPAGIVSMARLYGRAGRPARALALLAPLYEDADFITQNLDDASNDLMRLAASGCAAQALEMLQGSAAAPLLEPVVAALAEMIGERVDAPLEVREIAIHVRRRIGHLAASGDPWRLDPKTLPLDGPAAPAKQIPEAS